MDTAAVSQVDVKIDKAGDPVEISVVLPCLNEKATVGVCVQKAIDAFLLAPPEARRLLRECGFEVLRTDYRFIFPRALRALRKIEDLIHRAPLGTQYQVLCRKLG
jgi:hypothetical protein